jgi:hypothetical protein
VLGIFSGDVVTVMSTCPVGYTPIAASYDITNPFGAGVSTVTINTTTRTYAQTAIRYLDTGDASDVTVTAVCIKAVVA